MSKKQQLYNGVLENLTLNYLIISLKKIDLNLSKKKVFAAYIQDKCLLCGFWNMNFNSYAKQWKMKISCEIEGIWQFNCYFLNIWTTLSTLFFKGGDKK